MQNVDFIGNLGTIIENVDFKGKGRVSGLCGTDQGPAGQIGSHGMNKWPAGQVRAPRDESGPAGQTRLEFPILFLVPENISWRENMLY